MSGDYYSPILDRGFLHHSCNLGMMLLTPYPSYEECIDFLPEKYQIHILEQIEGLFTWGYYGVFGAMWKFKGISLAKYGVLLYNKLRTHSTYRPYYRLPSILQQKLSKGQPTFPAWWGDPIVHESHRTYIKTGDITQLKFPMKYKKTAKPRPKFI